MKLFCCFVCLIGRKLYVVFEVVQYDMKKYMEMGVLGHPRCEGV